ncbi:hypothetical protein Tco_0012757 [Tanacetum coccineum]
MENTSGLQEEKACRRGKVYNWETATYDKIWCDEDVPDIRSIETEFLAIVYNDAFTSEVTLSCEPIDLLQRNRRSGEYRSSGIFICDCSHDGIRTHLHPTSLLTNQLENLQAKYPGSFQSNSF